jgi:hypothetical protein
MREDIKKLVGESCYPTANVCTQLTAEFAQTALESGNASGFVDSLRLWRLADEDGDKESDAWQPWDDQLPLLWKIAPWSDDEEQAEEEEPAAPESLTDLTQHNIERAFDRATNKFPATFLTAWGCDALYDLLRCPAPLHVPFRCLPTPHNCKHAMLVDAKPSSHIFFSLHQPPHLVARMWFGVVRNSIGS